MKHLRFILLGLFFGALLTLSPGSIFVAALFCLSLYYLKTYVKSESRDFLIKLFIIGFTIRIIFAIFNYFFGLAGVYHGADTQPDAMVYNSNAFYIASVLRGSEYAGQFIQNPFLVMKTAMSREIFANNLPPSVMYQFNYYVYFLGIIYSWLGYSPIVAKFLNCLLGASSAIMVYFLANILVKSEQTSKISAFLVMFFPSMVFWSVTSLKDTSAIFFFIFYILILTLYLRKPKMSYFFGTLCVIFLLLLFKPRMASLAWLGFGLVLAMAALRNIVRRKHLTKIIALCLIFFVFVIFTAVSYSKIKGFIKYNLLTMFKQHVAFTENPSASYYKIHEDFVYEFSRDELVLEDFMNYRLIQSIPKALLCYFFSPLPWNVSRSRFLFLLVYPQVIFMLIAIPFMIPGFLIALRRNFFIVFVISIVLAMHILPNAIAEAVIGSVVRHRDMFLPFLIIFSVHGFYQIILRKRDGRE